MPKPKNSVLSGSFSPTCPTNTSTRLKGATCDLPLLSDQRRYCPDKAELPINLSTRPESSRCLRLPNTATKSQGKISWLNADAEIRARRNETNGSIGSAGIATAHIENRHGTSSLGLRTDK